MTLSNSTIHPVTMEVPIEPVAAFPVMYTEPLLMEQTYPYMHNLFIKPKLMHLQDPFDDSTIVIVKGVSEKMEDSLQNPIFYAGTLAKRVLPQENWKQVSSIVMFNFILQGGIPDHPEGIVLYHFSDKTLHYFQAGKNCYTTVDVTMVCLDLQQPACLASLGIFEEEELFELQHLLSVRSDYLSSDQYKTFLEQRGQIWLQNYQNSFSVSVKSCTSNDGSHVFC